MRSRKRKISITVILLIAGIIWLGYATLRQARLDKTLIQSIRADDTFGALHVLKNGADPNARDYGKSDGAFWPPIKRRFQRLFFRHSLHEQDQPISALALAAQYADVSCVRTLLEHGADVNAREDYGETALMMAATDGCDDNISALLDHGANVNLRNQAGETALIMAAQDGNDAAVFNLLDAGARVNFRTKDGSTALDAAIAGDNTAVIALLKKHGAAARSLRDKPLDQGGVDQIDLHVRPYG